MPEENNIFHASINGNLSKVRELIYQGSRVNIQNSLGLTPLHLASSFGHAELVAFLLESGAHVDLRDTLGNTPFHYAAQKPDNEEVIMELVKKKEDIINFKSNAGFTALHIAADRGQTNNVVTLLKCGAKPGITCYGRNPLHYAAIEGNNDAVIALLNYEALSESFNKVNGLVNEAERIDGCFALHLATMNGHHNVVSTLVKFGANVNAQNNFGITALQMATFYKHNKIVENLIGLKKTDVDIKNSYCGDTALHIAIKMGNIEAIIALMKADAKVDIKNDNYETALDIANKIEDESNRGKIIGLLSANSNERIEVKAPLNPASASKKRSDNEPDQNEPLSKKLKAARADRAAKLDRSGARSLG